MKNHSGLWFFGAFTIPLLVVVMAFGLVGYCHGLIWYAILCWLDTGMAAGYLYMRETCKTNQERK